MFVKNIIKSIFVLCVIVVGFSCQNEEEFSFTDEYQKYITTAQPDKIIVNMSGILHYYQGLDIWSISHFFDGTIDAADNYLIVEMPDVTYSFEEGKEVSVSGVCYKMPSQTLLDLAKKKDITFPAGMESYYIKVTELNDDNGNDFPWWDEWKVAEDGFVGIEDISFDNYPIVDGSTSASLLNTIVACKILGMPYRFSSLGTAGEWYVECNRNDIPAQHEGFFGNRVKRSQTHGAFINLIDGNADIILTHRTLSPDEKTHAESEGVTLIETPIALDAFVFVVNKNNPVKSLTISQIQKIYTGEITNWSGVGGNNMNIKAFTRPRNSGSEEIFRTMVMDGLEPADFPEVAIGAMFWVFHEVIENESGICYTFNNYKDIQARKPDSEVPKIAINGIFPDDETVNNRTYPFISEVHVAIRSDLSPNSMAYKLYEWLLSENAKYTIAECGFLAK